MPEPLANEYRDTAFYLVGDFSTLGYLAAVDVAVPGGAAI